MKKILTILISLFFIVTGKAQNTGIIFSAPNASSILEIKAGNKGLLIPRTSTASRNAIVNPDNGLLLYDTTTSSFWFYNGGNWVQIGTSGNGWSLTGNAGTNSNNFIGTTDEQSLVFKVNNKKAGFIDNSTFESGTRNTAFGLIALNSNTIGADNSAIGYGTLYSNQTGNQNAALGKYSLYNNNANNNTALGFNAMFFNTSGTNNTAIGSQALQNNTIGSSLTAIGSGVDVDGLNVYNNSTALGYGAIITGSNRIQLGNNAVTEVYAGTGGATLITGGLKVTGGTPAALELNGAIKVSGIKPVFVLTCDASNLTDNYHPIINYYGNIANSYYRGVYINNVLSNGDPNAMILITPINNPIPFAVTYDSNVGMWKIKISTAGVDETSCYGLATPSNRPGCDFNYVAVMPYSPKTLYAGDKFNVMIVKQ